MADLRFADLWQPTKLNWWVATLFMIGAFHFALGCALFLSSFTHVYTLDTVFFIGSLFFTSAAFCQLYQETNTDRPKYRFWQLWRPDRIDYLAALTQFIGTLFFNANTFDAYFELNWIENELLVWTPNFLGSVLFQVSGTLAMFGVCKRWWCWDIRSLDWWINAINFTGCVAFLISAVLSFVPPPPEMENFAGPATVFTLIGACCFFWGALLMWPANAKVSVSA